MAEQVEPWLRGTLQDLEPVRRAVLHALELAEEDAARWAAGLTDAEMSARPAGLPSVAFHLRHIVRSLDRLLTYAEQTASAEIAALSASQRLALATEAAEATAAEVLSEFHAGMQRTKERVLAARPASFAEVRWVGRRRLPTTVAALLIHCAEHTQRHAGQMVTTAKLVRSGYSAQSGLSPTAMQARSK